MPKKKKYTEKDVEDSLRRLARGSLLSDSRRLHQSENYDITSAIMGKTPATYPSHPPFSRLLSEDSKEGKEYLSDICEKTFSGSRYKVHDEFILDFWSRLFTEGDKDKFKLVKDYEHADKGRMSMSDYIEHICIAYQIPAVDVFTLLGVYVMHKAQKIGLVEMSQKVDGKSPCVVYKKEGQPSLDDIV